VHAASAPSKRSPPAWRQDGAAVRAALTLSWSNGQAEGRITRLKLLKRQSCG